MLGKSDERANMTKYPKTASDFLRAIEDAKRLSDWHIETIESDGDDDTAATRIVFRLAKDELRTSYVAFEYGKLVVNVDEDYYFDLDRLHEDYPAYSWQKHLSEKTWTKPVHLRFLQALCELIPPALKDRAK